ncbi:ABC transporter ATP-binding protein [Lewinella cohaerens]|uniref:ABC transporter ATP-binding protein n=1 Tax=Lewinella cohaerens TaxID=70995 RepID=UPI000371E770|nr:ATP-binding cassette domain-containing protein [Lewinella cohaerens]
MTNILEIKEVVKAYGSKIAVDRVSLTVPKGTIFGLLGPNGAGKTSLIRMITTITRPDAGEIILNGEPLNSDHPRQIGYLPEERGLYKKMKVGEHLLYLGQLKGLTAAAAKEASQRWLEKLGMLDRWNQPVEALSKGLQQQVQFIATIIHEPKLLILDEPFSGLDPVNTNRLKREIRLLNEQGTSIIFSTHRMEQVEEICEDIMLINAGQNVLQGAVSEIRERYKQYHFQLLYQGELPAAFAEHFPIIEQGKQSLTFAGKENETANTILRQLLQLGVQIRSFTEVLPSLNDIFIRTVGAAAPAS